jgi:nitrite reductase/ring-hydroxylating ferredoxin subunit
MKPIDQLYPYPNGWYCLAFSRHLPRGGLQTLTFMGRDIVLFRTQSGAPAAMDAYCPHLGAHLGYGGQVEGELLRCPFHGFSYDVQGNCAAIPYAGKAPPKAKAQVLPLREVHGLIMAFYDNDDRPPQWTIPGLETVGWSPLMVKTWTQRAHPQETTENSVDLGHFGTVHGYTSVDMLKPLTTDGPYLNVAYVMTRPTGPLRRVMRSEFEIHVYGLGYSLVEVQVPQYGLAARLFVLATPVEERRVMLRAALSLQQSFRPSRIHPLLSLVPRSLVGGLAARGIFAGFTHDFQQDFVIWRHKRYVQPPILAQGDGPIGRYRQWAKQFYPTTQAALV